MRGRKSLYDPCGFDRSDDENTGCSPEGEHSQSAQGELALPLGKDSRQEPLAGVGALARPMLDIPIPESSTNARFRSIPRFTRQRKRIWSKVTTGTAIPGRYFFLRSPRPWMRHGPFRRVGRYSFYACNARGTFLTTTVCEPLKAMVFYISSSASEVLSGWMRKCCDNTGRKSIIPVSFALKGSKRNPTWRVTSRSRARARSDAARTLRMRLRNKPTSWPSMNRGNGSFRDGGGDSALTGQRTG